MSESIPGLQDLRSGLPPTWIGPQLGPALLSVLSQQLEGQVMVAWCTAGAADDDHLVAWARDADASADQRLRVVAGRPAFSRPPAEGDPSTGVLSAAWDDYLASSPLADVVVLDAGAGTPWRGRMVVGRHDDAFSTNDRREISAMAHRLDGALRRADGRPEPQGAAMATGRDDLRRIAAPLLGGALAAAVVAVLLTLFDHPLDIRPTALFFGLTVVLALIAGWWAGLGCAVVATAAMWTFVASDDRTPGLQRDEVLGLLTLTAAVALVLVLVDRAERGRRSSEEQRWVADTLLDQAPVGIAMFDRDLRYLRVNRHLADMDGLGAIEHVGVHPSDIHPLLGQLYEPLLRAVRDSGNAAIDRILSLELPNGAERHWRISFYPLRRRESAAGTVGVMGVGAIVEEVTVELVGRRRSESLLRLARELSTVRTDQDAYDVLAQFIAAAFSADAAVAEVTAEDRSLVVRSLVAHGDHEPRRLHLDIPAGGISPMSEAAHTAELVAVADPDEYDRRFPEIVELRVGTGDQACAAVPVADPSDPARVLAVFRLAWPYPRELLATSRTLCATVASMVGSTLTRIRLADNAARDQFRAGLDAMLDDVAIGTAVRDETGRVVDFRLDYLSEGSRDGSGRGPDELTGRHVLEAYPKWKANGMFERFVAVVETGEPFVEGRQRYSGTTPEGEVIEGWWSLQVARIGDGYIAASRDVTEMVRLEDAEREARRAAEREQLSMELLQRAALPDRLPEVAGVDLGACYRPAAAVPIGGDWYDAFALADGSLGLVIADVAGHGSHVSSLTVQVRNITRALAAEHQSPDEVLRRVNEVMIDLVDSDGAFVTCCYAVVAAGGHHVRLALAGHPPPVIASQNGSRLMTAVAGAPLGLFEGIEYPVSEAKLDDGQRMVLYTDGLVERRGEILDVGLARLVGLCDTIAWEDAQSFADRLGGSVSDPFDDLAVLVAGPVPALGAQ